MSDEALPRTKSVRPHSTAKDAQGDEPVREILSFYVYGAQLRLWHWATVILVLGLGITGYLIGSPLPSTAGDTSRLFLMGTIRELHFIFAWLLAIGCLWRAYWAVMGDKHAREIYYLPIFDAEWRKGLYSMVRWYLFLDRSTHKWIGHNPLARVSMFVMFVLGATFMIVSGFGLYGEQLGAGSWADKMFGWTISVAGSSMTLRTWHHIGMYNLALFAIIHVYAAVRDEIVGRVNTISSMFSGWRVFRDTKD